MIESQSLDRKIVYVGRHSQFFPAPLVSTTSGWRFDDAAGRAELNRRRIQRNESAAVESCLRLKYAEVLRRADQAGSGQADGPFRNDDAEEDRSVVGPAIAAAFVGEQPSGRPQSHFGYYFKIITSGNSASPSRGTLIAWPAEYGIDGLQTFVMNNVGELYEKDLGPTTASKVLRIGPFTPDHTWSKVEID